ECSIAYQHTHQILSLRFSHTQINPPRIHHFFLARGDTSRAKTMGMVVSRDFKPHRFIKFDIGDGTDCIPCILYGSTKKLRVTSPVRFRHIEQHL
ncbi:hypothetical protein MTR67_036476, partial [Solanum verrucosum]